MLYKPRTEPKELRIFKVLNARMQFTSKDKKHFYKINKGYEGEKKFDQLTEQLESDCYNLNDLLLKPQDNMFQIDSLLIFPEVIRLYDIKNHEGEYLLDGERFYMVPNIEKNNPFHQLSRTNSLLRQLLQSIGYNQAPLPLVAFVNPEFTLFQTPLSAPIIFPTQLDRHMQELNNNSTKLNHTHKLIADKLVSMHIPESPYNQVPPYQYENLQKGLSTNCCRSLSSAVSAGNLICLKCGQVEKLETAIMRNVDELRLLFPELQITTIQVYDWCGKLVSPKRIRTALEKHFTLVHKSRWSYFVAKEGASL